VLHRERICLTARFTPFSRPGARFVGACEEILTDETAIIER
jgi:hypothetical protein